MRVLVCGSRSWNDIDAVANVLQRLTGEVTIIHGDAIGADTICHVVSEALDFKIEKFPITKEDWEKYGKSAGPRRNREMLSKGEPDFIIAFVDTLVDSPGTHGMIELGETNGKRVIVIRKDCWPEKCQTCGEPYSEPPTDRALICSSGFHCCRSCTWREGRITMKCKRHLNEKI